MLYEVITRFGIKLRKLLYSLSNTCFRRFIGFAEVGAFGTKTHVEFFEGHSGVAVFFLFVREALDIEAGQTYRFGYLGP